MGILRDEIEMKVLVDVAKERERRRKNKNANGCDEAEKQDNGAFARACHF